MRIKLIEHCQITSAYNRMKVVETGDKLEYDEKL